jgi:hypothetical protein
MHRGIGLCFVELGKNMCTLPKKGGGVNAEAVQVEASWHKHKRAACATF